MRYGWMLSAIAIAAPALAQSADPAPSLMVTGRGEVRTPPDLATIAYEVSGEGRTSDEASRQLAERNQALTGALLTLLGRDGEVTSGQVRVTQTRSSDCQGNGNYGDPTQLSQGACAVTGYILSLSGHFRTRAVEKAGTAVGLAGRMGARNARIEGFALTDPAAAQRRATAAAIADAQKRAEAAAAGAGVRLGPILSISDQGGGDAEEILVTGSRVADAPPAPPPPPPPVAIDIKPRPIETESRVYLRYAIQR